MVGWKQVRNIASGLLGTFTSRNNDINGYWGLGVLRLYAGRCGIETLEIDLLSQVSDELAGSPLLVAERYYRAWFSSALSNRQVDLADLSSARIRLRFSTFAEFPDVVRDTRGEPYVCCVSIANQHGVEYSTSRIGVCANHNPWIDSRRTRIYE